jgi:hypothetical protein
VTRPFRDVKVAVITGSLTAAVLATVMLRPRSRTGTCTRRKPPTTTATSTDLIGGRAAGKVIAATRVV